MLLTRTSLHRSVTHNGAELLSKETNQWGEGVQLIHKIPVLTIFVGVASLVKDELEQV